MAWIVLLGGLILVGLMVASLIQYRSYCRRIWKEEALTTISSLFSDPTWTTNELAALRQTASEHPESEDAWISPRVILMKNGEWIAYANVSYKQDWRISDLFLGRAWDGQWYYSTHHFCVKMVALKMRGQPDSIDQFTSKYWLRTFDGRSSICLEKTVPEVSE